MIPLQKNYFYVRLLREFQEVRHHTHGMRTTLNIIAQENQAVTVFDRQLFNEIPEFG
jgi:hypothetical protein